MWRRLQVVLMVLWCVGGCMLQDGGPLGAMQGAVKRVGATPSPRVSASPSASPTPLATPAPYYASPAPYERIAYGLPPGPDALLWLYDRVRQDLLVFPGAGVGITNVAEWNPYQFYYDDRRNIYLLDALREVRITLVDGFEVGGFAFSPAFDGKNNLYFLGTDDPDQAQLFTGFAYVKAAPQNGTDVIFGISTGASSGNGNGKDDENGNGNGKSNGNGNGGGNGKDTGSATGSVLAPVLGIGEEIPLAPVLGKPVFLSKINAVGAERGGISSINVCGTGDWVVFTTVDGGLYLYDTRRVVVQAVFADQEITRDMRAVGATIDPIWGRFVVWTDLGRRSVFVLDRWTRAIDKVPYAAIAWNAELVASPTFYGHDPFNLILLVLLPDGTFRLMVYNLLTEQLINLTLLNTVARGR
ncbi:hypothetical protein D3C72_96010 [compost metagenome]